MTFAAAIRVCLRKYATFKGRAPRSEYWWFILFVVLGIVVLGVIDMALFGTSMIETDDGMIVAESNGPLAQVFNLAMVIPMLSVGWRRMHDTGRSGLYLLYPLIVTVGLGTAMAFFGGIGALNGGPGEGLALLILFPALIILSISPLLVLWWLTRPSQPGANPYGPNPHEVLK
ncbi:DUF805 domain-containing protein [Oceaniglobus ichthyenteri]|uniref:DUF805 domain-containing protein n=1 Tax=Oceaniglobus ichthyenteri TaxID=2136177 RepID=UPI000D3DB117|nr:DUF805 domain-containing protein [Oceaniglobus ichthyenteri]